MTLGKINDPLMNLTRFMEILLYVRIYQVRMNLFSLQIKIRLLQIQSLSK